MHKAESETWKHETWEVASNASDDPTGEESLGAKSIDYFI